LFNSPWGIDVAKDENSQFWRLMSGTCTLGLASGEIIILKEGDLVFIPQGASHWIADKEGSSLIKAAAYIKARLAGQSIFQSPGNETVLIGGHFQFEKEQLHPFFKDMPAIIHIKSFETENQLLLQHSAQLIFNELKTEKQGSRLILRGLSELLFIQIIRAYLEQFDTPSGFLSALNDSRVSKALKIIQEQPDQEWTIETLANEIGMSRSAFFNRFKKLTGETPSNYLTNWRINRAKQLLVKTDNNINDVAINVGYRSEAAFNRIFKTKTGLTPAIFRRKNIS
jgi:AraC-like DNA-binding protein